jgi:RecA/RadA recombinase
MPELPEEYKTSRALQFVQQQGWTWRPVSPPKIELETCPHCSHDGWHAYMEVYAKDDPEASRDGLHGCVRCNKGGGLRSLKEKLGIELAGVSSGKDWAGQSKEAEGIIDTDALHTALMADEDALAYLMEVRGFSLEIIQEQKLGLKDKHFFRETGEVRALVYPYLVNGNTVWWHYRTLPSMPIESNKIPKAFSSPTGWDATLYNGGILLPGLTDLTMFEGEPDTIAALDHGLQNVVGVPGANIKKAAWIDTIDKLGLDHIYICYDNDKVGQRAAQALATRIGIERCYKLLLPAFTVEVEGVMRPGKDINEWFLHGGGTLELFEQLKLSAPLFDVEGVADSGDALQQLEDELLGKGSILPKYQFPWDGVNKYLGLEDGDVLDVLAPEKVGKTTWAMNLLEHMVNTYEDDGVFICLEMTVARQVRKWLAHVAQIADTNTGLTPEEAEALRDEFLTKIPIVKAKVAGREGQIYFCYPQYKTMEELYNIMRQIIRRYGVKWIVFDNIQRAADTTSTAKGGNRTEHLSQISKVLSQMAKDHNVNMVRILQPNRIGKGQIVSSDNVDGSSQIAKDCDAMIVLHRNKIESLSTEQFQTVGFVEEEASFSNEMLCKVALTRYSGGGVTTLMYDGPRSTVNEMGKEHKSKLMAEATKDVGHAAQLDKLFNGSKVVDPQDATVEG